jgi:hypothetical protein
MTLANSLRPSLRRRLVKDALQHIFLLSDEIDFVRPPRAKDLAGGRLSSLEPLLNQFHHAMHFSHRFELDRTSQAFASDWLSSRRSLDLDEVEERCCEG